VQLSALKRMEIGAGAETFRIRVPGTKASIARSDLGNECDQVVPDGRFGLRPLRDWTASVRGN